MNNPNSDGSELADNGDNPVETGSNFETKVRHMAKYRESFDLNVTDVSLIEESLSARVGQISRAIMEHTSPDRIQAYKRELAEVRDLLGRIHNQKIWYQPQGYVPQG